MALLKGNCANEHAGLEKQESKGDSWSSSCQASLADKALHRENLSWLTLIWRDEIAIKTVTFAL